MFVSVRAHANDPEVDLGSEAFTKDRGGCRNVGIPSISVTPLCIHVNCIAFLLAGTSTFTLRDEPFKLLGCHDG
ncbi:hypothetical protein B0T16DRAFT_400824 [Cercophora newfieldiana]|uniref:Uncharacterized protein n=1 Tax=Cercophora newfieldiana TaxID=92897 RepID=A0AA40CZ81_9PEZI|nr:hypothetical protein B0T16DRAFT_400824 [Cercophora newfieldiana]